MRIDVAALHIHPAGAVAVGQQLLTAVPSAFEGLHHCPHLGLDEAHDPALAALGGVIESHDPVAADRDVLLAHRGEPEGLVPSGVLLAADPEEAEIEQAYRTRQHPLTAQPITDQVAIDALAGPREHRTEIEDPLVLVELAHQSPLVVLAILPPTCDIDAGRLNVSGRQHADPYV